VSTMILSSLNIDVLLHLIKFLDSDDRFNLALSGILQGLENLNKRIDLQKRYSEFFTQMQAKWWNQIVTFPELKKLALNWGYVVIARAN
jgi:hypothetical protein